MAVKIELKRSAIPGKVPSIEDLGLGELAINTHDGKLFLKQEAGGVQNILEIGATGSAVSSSYASYAALAGSAGYATTAGSSNTSISSSYALTASYAANVPTTASYSLSSLSSSYALTASYAANVPTTASYALQTLSSSYALTASYAVNVSNTASYAISSSYASTASYSTSSSYATYGATSSYATNFTASNILVNGTITAQTLNIQTVSSSIIYSSGSNVFGNNLTDTQQLTGSVSVTGSLSVNRSLVILTNQTSSMSVLSSSYASTASYVQNAQTASYVLNAVSSSYSATASYFITSSVTSASVAISASYALSGSYAISASAALQAQTASYITIAQTASYVLNAQTASYVTGSVHTSTNPATFATTASYAITSSFATNFTASNILVNNTLTAQTLVVQTVTSSVVYSSGSNVFGNNLSNTQVFTGSVNITGSLNLDNLLTAKNISASVVYAHQYYFDNNAAILSYVPGINSIYSGTSSFFINNNTGGSVLVSVDNNTGNTVITGTVTAASLIKSGGTSTQFLKADGSVDTNTYVTGSGIGGRITFWNGTNSITSFTGFTFNTATELLTAKNISGSGTITMGSLIKSGGTSTQFLKADGTVDSNAYLPLTAGSGYRITGSPFMANNQFIYGRNPGNTADIAMIGISSGNGDKVYIDPSAFGSIFGGTVNVSGTATLTGNVGIGTTSPAYKLDVNSSTSPSTLMLRANAVGTRNDVSLDFNAVNVLTSPYARIGLQVTTAGAGSETAGLTLWTINNGSLTEKMSLTGTGQLNINTTNWPTSTVGNSAGRHIIGGSNQPILLMWNEATPAINNLSQIWLGAKTATAGNYIGGGYIVGGIENALNSAGFLKLYTTDIYGTQLPAIAINFAQNVTFYGQIAQSSLFSAGGTNNAYFYNVSTTGFGLFTQGGDATRYALSVNKYDGTNAMTVLGNGNTTISGPLTTASPSTGTAQPWKLGSYTAGGVTTTGYIFVEINGQMYSIPALLGTP